MPISDYYTSASLNVAISGINIGEGMSRADVNNAFRQMMADQATAIGNADYGTLPAGTTYTPFIITKTAAANSAGNSDWRAVLETTTITGAFGATQFNARNIQHNLMHTAGTVAAAVGFQGYSALGTPSSATTTGNVTTVRGFEYHISHTGSGTISDAFCFYSLGPDLDVGVGAMTRFNSFRSGDISGGSGSNRISTESFGFFQANCSVVTTPIMASYGSEMSNGTGRWHWYITGGASSFHAGRVRLGGSATVPTETLEVVGGIRAFTSGGTVASLGFSTSAGGTVTQLTSKGTGVTLNKPCGQIVMHNASLPADSAVSFVLTNDQIASTDVVNICIGSGSSAGGSQLAWADSVSNGSCRINLRNMTAGAIAESPVLNFAIIKSVTA